jgi:hypothetical protein
MNIFLFLALLAISAMKMLHIMHVRASIQLGKVSLKGIWTELVTKISLTISTPFTIEYIRQTIAMSNKLNVDGFFPCFISFCSFSFMSSSNTFSISLIFSFLENKFKEKPKNQTIRIASNKDGISIFI